MKKLLLIALLVCVSCANRNKYDVSGFSFSPASDYFMDEWELGPDIPRITVDTLSFFWYVEGIKPNTDVPVLIGSSGKEPRLLSNSELNDLFRTAITLSAVSVTQKSRYKRNNSTFRIEGYISVYDGMLLVFYGRRPGA